METKFNFNSQICTTREQSERLLALGLKKETADMYRTPSWGGVPSKIIGYYCPNVVCFDDHFDVEPNDLPAWSLHRLLLLIPKEASIDGFTFPLRLDAVMRMNDADDMYECVIGILERKIKEGYFNKEYLI